jgi:hypothetical protein
MIVFSTCAISSTLNFWYSVSLGGNASTLDIGEVCCDWR